MEFEQLLNQELDREERERLRKLEETRKAQQRSARVFSQIAEETAALAHAKGFASPDEYRAYMNTLAPLPELHQVKKVIKPNK